MKKTLGIAMLVAVLAGVASVQAEDSAPGRLGIGYQGTLYDGFFPLNQIAFRFAPKPLGGQLVVGQMREDSKDVGGDDSEHLVIQAKCFYSLISREHSDFYIGGLVGLDNWRYNGDDENIFGLGVLVGAEWYFTELPEIGFNFELGYNASFDDDEGEDTMFNGTSVSLGATYYF